MVRLDPRETLVLLVLRAALVWKVLRVTMETKVDRV